MDKRLYTTKQAAFYMGMTETALRNRKCKGTVPEWITRKIGSTVYYDRVKMDQWLDISEAA